MKHRLLALAMAAAVCVTSLLFLSMTSTRARPDTLSVRPFVRTSLRPVHGQVDGVLALPRATIALVGPLHGPRFLPHDDLLLLRPGHRPRTIALPAYTTPPGLAVGPNGLVDVVIDRTLLLLDTRRGQVAGRWRLDLQAIGWPAAVAGDGRHLYVGGEANGSFPSAEAEALVVNPGRPPRLLWRRRLGYTHAGLWIGEAGQGLLAVYVPNSTDSAGTVALLDARSGILRRTYAVPAPPLASDPRHDRLYLADGGVVRALKVSNGMPVATMRGSGPLAADPARGLVALTNQGRLVLADACRFHLLTRLESRDPQPLALASAGTSLLVGFPGGLQRIDLSSVPSC